MHDSYACVRVLVRVYMYVSAFQNHQIFCSAEFVLWVIGTSTLQEIIQARMFKASLEAEKALAAKAYSTTLLNLDDEERLRYSIIIEKVSCGRA